MIAAIVMAPKAGAVSSTTEAGDGRDEASAFRRTRGIEEGIRGNTKTITIGLNYIVLHNSLYFMLEFQLGNACEK